jgi:hypothetical protein
LQGARREEKRREEKRREAVVGINGSCTTLKDINSTIFEEAALQSYNFSGDGLANQQQSCMVPTAVADPMRPDWASRRLAKA